MMYREPCCSLPNSNSARSQHIQKSHTRSRMIACRGPDLHVIARNGPAGQDRIDVKVAAIVRLTLEVNMSLAFSVAKCAPTTVCYSFGTEQKFMTRSGWCGCDHFPDKRAVAVFERCSHNELVENRNTEDNLLSMVLVAKVIQTGRFGTDDYADQEVL